MIGSAAPAFATSLSGICPVAICHDLEQATRAAFDDASADPDGGTILLAPAAASFDQFPNFERAAMRLLSLPMTFAPQDMPSAMPVKTEG